MSFLKIRFNSFFYAFAEINEAGSGKPILKFSQGFQKEIESLQAKNCQLKSARVNFIVYLKREDSGEEIKMFLPELVFEKNP